MGFFTSSDLIESHTPNCAKCGLWKTCNSPKMQPTGNGIKKVLVIAEAPGETEDRIGKQLIGQAGTHLRELIGMTQFRLEDDCRKMNAINCRPPNNREPTDKEIECCRPLILKEIHSFKPRAIILLGKAAIKSVIGPLYKDTEAVGSVSLWVDRTIPCFKYNTWLLPSYHPSYLLRQDSDPLLKWSVLNTFTKARKIYQQREDLWAPVPRDYPVEIVESVRQFTSILKQYTKKDRPRRPVAFDYETSGLRPDRPGHFIRSMSISDGHSTFSGLVDLTDIHFVQALRSFLLCWNVPKIGANIKFETRWSKKFLGVAPRPWVWDTMMAQHFLDNRKESTSLKFQAFVRWGLSHYGMELEPFLASHGAEFNTIADAPVAQLLQYGGIDALGEFRLAAEQRTEWNERRETGPQPIQSPLFRNLVKWMDKRKKDSYAYRY